MYSKKFTPYESVFTVILSASLSFSKRFSVFAMRLFRCCIIVVAGCFSLLRGRCLLLRLVAVELAEDLQRPFRLFLLLSLLDEKHLKACHLVCKRGDLRHIPLIIAENVL